MCMGKPEQKRSKQPDQQLHFKECDLNKFDGTLWNLFANHKTKHAYYRCVHTHSTRKSPKIFISSKQTRGYSEINIKKKTGTIGDWHSC